MKRYIVLLLSAVLVMLVAQVKLQAQRNAESKVQMPAYQMILERLDGTTIKIPTNEIRQIWFEKIQTQEPETPGEPETPVDPVQGQDFTDRAFGVNFDMVWVEGGTFTMGCTSEQGSDCTDYDLRSHNVSLSGYYIGKYEVTQAQWRAVMGSNPSYFTGDDLSVETVSWYEAQEFCQKLSERTGKTYTLPTEAQWEYAARGGRKSQRYKYSGSNTLYNVAWFAHNSGSKTHAVGTQSPNELGIYDMSGNVWEWCLDCYYYTGEEQTDPQGPTSDTYRTTRGGDWSDVDWLCRVSYRNPYCYPSYPSHNGFRVVMLP